HEAALPDGTRENEVCPVYRATVATRPEPEPNPDEVHDTEWVPWEKFLAEVDADPTSVSPWCAHQVDQPRARGPAPRTWPVAENQRLPDVAREPMEQRSPGISPRKTGAGERPRPRYAKISHRQGPEG